MKRNSVLVIGFSWLLVLAAAARADDAKEAMQLVRQAQELARDRKFAAASAAMRKAIKLAPRSHQVLGIASQYEHEAGEFAEGLAHARQALALDGKVGAYYVLAAANAYGVQDVEAARGYVEKVLKAAAGTFDEGAIKDARVVEDRLVKKTYTLYWNLNPREGRRTAGAFSIALPKGDLPYQSVKYTVSGARSHKLIKTDVNDVLRVVPQGTRSIQLTTYVTVQPYSFRKELAKRTSGPLPRAVLPYLSAADTIDPANPKLQKIVADLKKPDSVATVKNILGWMAKNVEYDFKAKSIVEQDFKTAVELVERGKAECRGYSILFTALCRAAKIPARPVWGLAMLPPSSTYPKGNYASHNWAEVFIAGSGWIPVDPQHPESFGFLPTNDLRFFMDLKKTPRTTENLPLVNLLFMNGPKIKFEESRGTKAD